MLRNLAIRLVLWLCARYEISLIDETRRHATADKIARAEEWKNFATEDGGLFDMIAEQRRAAFEAYSECRPGDVAEKEYLAQQDRCWRQIKSRVDGIIQTGQIEADNRRKIAATISPIRKSV